MWQRLAGWLIKAGQESRDRGKGLSESSRGYGGPSGVYAMPGRRGLSLGLQSLQLTALLFSTEGLVKHLL